MMYRNATIITKIRPIKKLCIIEEGDLDRFIQIIKNYSMDIAGIMNLILINNSGIYSINTIDFIVRHDPDVIVNYSSCDDDKLKSLFKTLVMDGKNKNFKWSNIASYTKFLNNIPDAAEKKFAQQVKTIYTNFDNQLDKNNIMYYLNFGLVDENLIVNLKKTFKGTIFEKIDLRSIRGDTLNPIGKLLNQVSSNNLNNVLFLSVAILWPIFSESIFAGEIDYNENEYYKKPTIVFGHQDDIESMVYFWNQRATYPFLNQMIWLPLEYIDEYRGYIRKFKNFCIFSKPSDDIDNIINKVTEMNESITKIDNSKYYFKSRSGEWESFKSKQIIPIIDNKFTIKHPSDKLFSRSGFNFNTVLEIYGIEEMSLPKSLGLGEIFTESVNGVVVPHYNSVIQSHIFSRVGSRGLAFAFSELEFFKSSPLIYDVCLPSDKLVLNTLMEEHQLQLIETNGSQIIEQVINLISGSGNLEILNEKRIFELLVDLAPKRIRRIVKDIAKEINKSISEGHLEALINEKISPITTINSNIYVDMENLLARFPKEDREKYGSLLQELYKNRILLRGKSFKCPHCNSILWYSLSALNDDLKCYCCGNKILLPILVGSANLEDSFKLNELICNAVDQGILPLLLTANFLFKQRFCGKRFIFNNIICDKNTKKQLAEVDILFTIGALIGMAEVKADRGFEDHNQIDKLLDMSRKIGANLIIFSTLKSKDSAEIQELINYLKTKNIDIYIFILTKESLFEKELINLGDYTRNILSSDKSHKRIVIIEKKT